MYEKKLWKDKRYHSVDSYIEEKYARKMYKLALNGGMTCPNRDGTIGKAGCIFCSKGGSGDFASDAHLSVTEQIEQAAHNIRSKVKKDTSDENNVGQIYIAYFQAYTNTYAPVEYLRKIFYEAINNPEVAILSIATRPDCLGDDVIELLDELNKIKPVWIELGLQTIHETTADFIRRGYKLEVFNEAVERLNRIGVEIIVHMIIGLPDETTEMILQSIDYVSHMKIQGIKLQLLHILKDSSLADYLPDLQILSMDEYTDIIVECIEHLPQEIIIHRITGDGPKETLLAPLWSSNKRAVINEINRKMKQLNSWQGKKYN